MTEQLSTHKFPLDRGAHLENHSAGAFNAGVEILDGQRGHQGRLGGGTDGVHGQARSMYAIKRKQLLLSHLEMCCECY